ncbi:MAG: rhgT [Gemmatimonadetes bacterium]|nr:rhgT [Gemmatimonadota bacterium]
MKTPKRFTTALILPVLLAAALAFRAAPIVTIYLAGDSTMAAKANDKRPETGWGEALGACFNPATVRIVNRAVNGRSTKSFVAEGRWKAIIDSLQPGDYVAIQFGHNDEKVDMPAGSTPEVYGENLARFVDQVREKDATPILLTPVARRKWSDDSRLVDTHGKYPDVAYAISRQKKVPFIDMHRNSERVLERYGPDSSKALFLQLAPGEHPNYPAGVQDDTHFSPLGAREMAGLFVDGIRQMGFGLREHLRSCPARP